MHAVSRQMRGAVLRGATTCSDIRLPATARMGSSPRWRHLPCRRDACCGRMGGRWRNRARRASREGAAWKEIALHLVTRPSLSGWRRTHSGVSDPGFCAGVHEESRPLVRVPTGPSPGQTRSSVLAPTDPDPAKYLSTQEVAPRRTPLHGPGRSYPRAPQGAAGVRDILRGCSRGRLLQHPPTERPSRSQDLLQGSRPDRQAEVPEPDTFLSSQAPHPAYALPLG